MDVTNIITHTVAKVAGVVAEEDPRASRTIQEKVIEAVQAIMVAIVDTQAPQVNTSLTKEVQEATMTSHISDHMETIIIIIGQTKAEMVPLLIADMLRATISMVIRTIEITISTMITMAMDRTSSWTIAGSSTRHVAVGITITMLVVAEVLTFLEATVMVVAAILAATNEVEVAATITTSKEATIMALAGEPLT